MAENTSTISKEDRNFWILNILIQHVAPTAVRKVFNEKIPPNELANILSSNVKIIQELVNKKVIKTHEQDVLVRIPGFKLPSMPASPNKTESSSEDFDITLMICILRNLNIVHPPSSGWDRIPPINDNSLGAHLTRIKNYRNKLCHSSKASINDKTFRRIWASLTSSFSEMSCGETDKIVREIKNVDFEGCDKEKLLCKIQKELQEIRGDLQFYHNWKVNTANVLDEWRAELETFYETKGAKEVIEQLNTNNAVMIIGNSGIGKTATMKYVSLLFESKGYEVVLITSPNDILFRFPERKQLFIMDDIIGKYRVDSAAVELWRRLHDRLRVVFKDKNVKLLSTLRRQLYADMSSILFPTVFSSTIVDLESNNLVLSLNEKKGMLENYLKRRNITQDFDDDEMLRICSCQIAFPLLSNLFTSDQNFFKMKSTFFHSPSMIFKEELNRLQLENKVVYCVLVLVIIFHLEELHMIFDINCEIKRIEAYNKILRACELLENIARKTLHRHLQSVAGTFVETTNIFKFQHDKLEETIACHFGSQFPDIMLQYCKLDFIRDRVRLTRMPTDDENILVLKQSSFDVFSKRVMDEIKKGKFWDILLSEPMHCEKFIQKFASYLKNNQRALKYTETALCTEMLLPPLLHEKNNTIRVLSVANRFALLEELQSRKKRFIHWVAAMGCVKLFTLFFKIPEKKHSRTLLRDLLHLAVSGENIDVVKLLIDEGGNLNSYDEYGIPLICKIAGSNRCDIAELLIDNGANVNQTDQILGWTTCHVATWFNEAEMLTFLLSRGASINEFDSQLKVPLAIAVVRNNTEAVSVLLKNGADIYIEAVQIWNSNLRVATNFGVVLEVALNINNPKIVRMLTDNMKRHNLISMAFPVAIRKKDIVRKLVNVFLGEMRSVDLKSSLWKDFIEICEAIYKNDIHRIETIFAKGEEIDIYSFLRGVSSIKHRKKILSTLDDNYLRFCPLHVSSTCNNTTAAKILIQHGADPFQRDVLGRTSLHLASSRAMLTILLSINDEPKPLSTNSLFSRFKGVLIFLISFEIIPFVLASFANLQSDSKANVRDKNGNTPIHSMIIRMIDPNECLDSVETLIDNGADINIRCNSGYLPIDHFRTVSLRFDEATIDRAERLLGGNRNKSFVNKEKWYLGVLATVFIAFYILLSFNIAKMTCYRIEKSSSSKNIERFYFHPMDYIQITFLVILHRLWHNLVIFIQAFLVCGVDIIPLRSKLYSDKLFVRFSEKVGLGFLSDRFIALKFDFIYSTYIFFNVYCILVCIFFCMMYIPYSCRNWIQKYHGILVLAYKISLVFCLGVWILYLLLVISFETRTCIINIDEEHFSWSELLLFVVSKVIVLYMFFGLFIPRLFRPLIFNVLQPIYSYRQYGSHLICTAYLLFLIFEILLVPISLVFCDIPNC